MSTSEADATKQPRADARRNRLRIIEAARRVFSEEGVEAQIDDVARYAGVGVGTVYRHFPTKEALVREMVREKFAHFAANARAAVAADDKDPFTALSDLMRANAGCCAQDATMRYALSGAGKDGWSFATEEIAELLACTQTLIERAHAAGAVRADLRPSDVAMLMCGVSTSMALDRPGFDWHRHLELVIDMLRPPAR